MTQLNQITIDRTMLQSWLAKRIPGKQLDLPCKNLSHGIFDGVKFDNVLFKSQGSSALLSVTFRNCEFVNCKFEGAVKSCFFTHARFKDCRFRDSTLGECDFRYSLFEQVTFAGASINFCDFYRAEFSSNVIFERATLVACSFHRTVIDGCDLEWDSIKTSGIVQSDVVSYTQFLENTVSYSQGKKLSKEEISDYAALGHLEAATIFRKFSAVFAARGRYIDSSEAYVSARRLERYGFKPSVHYRGIKAEENLRKITTIKTRNIMVRVVIGLLSYVQLWLADLTCRFGTSVSRVLLSLGAVTLGFAEMYWKLGALKTSRGVGDFSDSLAFSLGKMVADIPEGIHLIDLWRPLAGFQVFLSLALIGLLGFVLGNFFRQS